MATRNQATTFVVAGAIALMAPAAYPPGFLAKREKRYAKALEALQEAGQSPDPRIRRAVGR